MRILQRSSSLYSVAVDTGKVGHMQGTVNQLIVDSFGVISFITSDWMYELIMKDDLTTFYSPSL